MMASTTAGTMLAHNKKNDKSSSNHAERNKDNPDITERGALS
jgi:hypothetical protein